MALPSNIKKYFWDIDPKKAAPKKHPEYYIKRILEYGDLKAYSWLKRVYGLKKIERVAKKSNLSSKSSNFWRLFFR